MNPKFPELLKVLRKRKGLTQEDLANLLGISRITIARWESGVRHPTADQLMALSKVLEVSPEELLKGYSGLEIRDIAKALIEETYKEEGLGSLSSEDLNRFLPLVTKKLEALKEELKWFISLKLIEDITHKDIDF